MGARSCTTALYNEKMQQNAARRDREGRKNVLRCEKKVQANFKHFRMSVGSRGPNPLQKHLKRYQEFITRIVSGDKSALGLTGGLREVRHPNNQTCISSSWLA